MTEIGIDFEVLVEGQSALPAWTKVAGHLVWDLLVKIMDDSKSLISQNYIKEAHPANLVDFYKAHGITD